MQTLVDLDRTCSIQRTEETKGVDGICNTIHPRSAFVLPSALAVAAAPPPLRAVARRSVAAPDCRSGTSSRVLSRFTATESDEKPPGAWSLVTSLLLAEGATRDVVGDAGRSGSSGRAYALHLPRRGGLARAREPRGVRRRQPWEHRRVVPVPL